MSSSEDEQVDGPDEPFRRTYKPSYIRKQGSLAARTELARLFSTSNHGEIKDVSNPNAFQKHPQSEVNLEQLGEVFPVSEDQQCNETVAAHSFSPDCDASLSAVAAAVADSVTFIDDWAKCVVANLVDVDSGDCDDTDSSSSDASDSCQDSNDEEQMDLSMSLQQWSTHYNIPNNALDSLLCILKPLHPQLSKDSRTLKGTPTKTNIKMLNNGQYNQLGLKKGISSKLKHGVKNNDKDIALDIFCDGVKLYNSVMSESWPILFRSEDLIDNTPSVVGLFYGDGKPNPVDEYFSDLISELKELFAEGIITFSDVHYTVHVRYYLGDAPARSMMKCTVGHTSKNGCERCDAEGDFIDHVVYPVKIGNLRTDESFDEMRDEEHHKGVSPFKEVNAKCISQMPLDPMHLIDYGVSKRFLEYVLHRAPRHLRVSCNNVFAEFLNAFSKFRPCEFTRMPSLRKLSKWKSKEYRMLLLYLCPVIFAHVLCEEVYHLFLLLHSAVFIMHSDTLISTYLDDAERFLIDFVKCSSELFGRKFIVFNVHSAMHLADDVRRFGNLRSFWAYPFEDKLGGIKKLVKPGNHALQQMCRRLAEKEKAFDIGFGNYKKKPGGLMHHHLNGPLADLPVVTQFAKYEHPEFTLTTEIPNSCVCLSDGSLGLVQNIVCCEDSSVKVIVKLFESVVDLFTYPMPSSNLGTCVVSDLSNDLKCFLLSDVMFKCFFLPYENDKFAVIPLVHLL